MTPHILAEKKDIFTLLPSLLVFFWFTTAILKPVKHRSLNHTDGLQQVRGGVGRKKNNLQREDDDADSCFPLKDKARRGCRDHQSGRKRDGEKKDKIEYPVHQKDWTHSIHQPGAWNTDSLRSSERMRGWEDGGVGSVALLENQVVGLDLRVGST